MASEKSVKILNLKEIEETINEIKAAMEVGNTLLCLLIGRDYSSLIPIQSILDDRSSDKRDEQRIVNDKGKYAAASVV